MCIRDRDDPNRNTRAESDRYLENGSYLRLRSVQLGYTFPQTWFKGAIPVSYTHLLQ